MKNISKQLILTAAVSLITSQAYAHTTIKDQASENMNSYNALNIGHVCGGDTGTESYPVIGQTALFPYGDKVVWRKMSTATPAVEISKSTGGDGGGVIAAGTTLSMGVSGYDGYSSPFASMDEIVDDLGNVQALH
jgi:hypothetical protein